MAEPTLQTLGRYTIRAEIGRGGFATVYQALDTSLNREVALKVLHPQLLTDRSFVERFRKEARTLAGLRHAHIVTIYEVSEVEGRLFIVMDLAHGPSLAQAIADRKRIPWTDALSILKPVSEALDYAHGQGVVHRDLKPANILLDAERGPLLTDFGFARLLGDSSASMSLSGGILGTPAYIAPEVWELDTAASTADIYALGCIAYEMLTGAVLFPGKTPMQSMRAHDHGPQFPAAWPGDVPPGIDAVLQVALTRKPESRYPKATTFWHALNDLEANAQIAREQAERQAVADQWKAEVAAAMAASEWSAAKMAVGRWLSITPNDPQAQAARKEIERQMQLEAERQQKEEAERAAQALLAAEAARRAEEERTRQEAERKAKEEADRKAREEQERQRQADLAAQTAATDKAKREAEENERQRQVAQAVALEKSKREAAERERQRRAAVQEAQGPTAGAPRPEKTVPAPTAGSDQSTRRKWAYIVGAVIIIVMIGILIGPKLFPGLVATPAPTSVPPAPTPVRAEVLKATEAPANPAVSPKPTEAPAPSMKVLHTNTDGSGDVTTLDPSLALDTTSVQMIDEFTIGLTHPDEATNEVQPGMAVKWDVSPDGKTYTFYLRNDVPWVKWDNASQAVVKVQNCDGSDRMVTAQDFAYGILRTLAPKTASGYAYLLNFAIAGASDYNSGTVTDAANVGVKVIDDFTLQVTFNEPATFNASIIGMWIAHAQPSWLIDGDACTAAKGDRWIEMGTFQGYGPYTLKEWAHDSTMTLVKNPFWPGIDNIPQAQIEEVTFSMLDPEAAFADYEAGKLDVAAVPSAELERVKSDSTLSKELKITPSLCTYYYGFNTQAPFVDDARVRRALSMAIDRQVLIDSVLKGGQEPAQWFARPGLAGAPTMADHPNLGIKFDPAGAKALLDEYLKEKNLTADQLDITLMINTSPQHQQIADAIQQMWKQYLGIDVKVASEEWKAFLSTIKDPKNTPQIWRLGWCQDYADANNFDREVFARGGSANPQGGGGINWDNADYEQLVMQAAWGQDSQKRVELYAEAEDILVNKDAAVMPIYWYTRATETKPYVTRTFASGGSERYEKWDIDMGAKGTP